MKQKLMNLIIYGGGHYFYVLLIQELNLIPYRIAWLVQIVELSLGVNHPSDLWLWIWRVIH